MESFVPSGCERSKVSPGGLSVTDPPREPPTSVTFTDMVAGFAPPVSLMKTVWEALEWAGIGTVRLVAWVPPSFLRKRRRRPVE